MIALGISCCDNGKAEILCLSWLGQAIRNPGKPAGCMCLDEQNRAASQLKSIQNDSRYSIQHATGNHQLKSAKHIPVDRWNTNDRFDVVHSTIQAVDAGEAAATRCKRRGRSCSARGRRQWVWYPGDWFARFLPCFYQGPRLRLQYLPTVSWGFVCYWQLRKNSVHPLPARQPPFI
jgi:hypothetical protein